MAPSADVSVDISHEGEASPLMALVDAASSLMDKKGYPTTASSEGSELSPSNSHDSKAKEDQERNLGSEDNSSPLDKRVSFAEQLMALLDDDANAEVIAWMPDGKAFTIIDPKRFTKVEMPKHFNIRNMSSFVRKLTRWGFRRFMCKETMNSDLFKHKDFQRGNLKLCSEIKCLGRNPVPSAVAKNTSLKQIMAAKVNNQRKPSSSDSAAPSTTSKSARTQVDKSLKDLNEARLLAQIRHLLKSRALPLSLSTAPSDPLFAVLALAGGALQDPNSFLAKASSNRSLAAEALALQSLIDASHQQQLAHMAAIRLTTTASSRLTANALQGFPSYFY